MVSDEELFGSMNQKEARDLSVGPGLDLRPLFPESSNNLQVPSGSGSVVKRTFFQKTVFLVYPNGNVSVCKGECSSWFTDSKEMWKKKKKKKAKPIKQVKMDKEEVY
jgi:hypothetical protein